MNLPLINTVLTEKQAFAKLSALGQEKLVAHWGTLNSEQKLRLLSQIAALDPIQIERQKKACDQVPPFGRHHEPFETDFFSGNENDQKKGHELTSQGVVACLVLAGGQGSRLRVEGAKGCVPITLVKRKTLFQFLTEKVKAAGDQAGRPLDLAVMTSPLNHDETIRFFAENHNFGLDPEQITFFSQKMLPLLDFEGNLFLEAPDSIARGPNGNGGVFQRLVESGLWHRWKKKGIKWVNVVPIDNPLALPFDHELLGFGENLRCDVVVKAALRETPDENVGSLALFQGKPVVIEYSELTQEEKMAKNEQGGLKYHIANLGLYCFSMPFILQASQTQMPLHGAKKAVKRFDTEKGIIFPDEPNSWKFEEFIFDVLPLATFCQALLYPRALCFAPLKNLKGEGSIASVQAALLAYDHQVFARISGIKPPKDAVFELAPEFYYPTRTMIDQWRGKPLPEEPYISVGR